MQGRAVDDRVKYWEIIADNLSKAGWSLGLHRRLGFSRENIKLDGLLR
jgi:hypothetical protein